MQVSKITFNDTYKNEMPYKRQYKTSERKYSSNVLNLNNSPAFRGNVYNISFVDEKNFLEKGGTLNFDKAYLKNGDSYSGRLVNNSKNMQVVSSYSNGVKTDIKLAWDQCNDSYDTIIFLKKESETNYEDKSKTVLWQNSSGDIEYAENYNAKGKLTYAVLTAYKNKNENEVIMSVNRNYNSDGVSLYSERTNVSERFHKLSGYKTRYSIPVENGTREILYKVISKDGSREADKRTACYDKNNKIIRSTEENVKYFDRNSSIPYATAEKRTAVRTKDGQAKISDFYFSTDDYSRYRDQVRNIAYSEHKNTIRKTKGENVYFYDADTKECYAFEHYPKGAELPDLIADFENKKGIIVNGGMSNVLLIDYYKIDFENDTDLHVAASCFEKKYGKLVLKQTDIINPETGKRTAAKVYYPDGRINVTHYDKNGKITETTEEYA